MANLWYVGVLLEILSTISGTIGKQLIRFAENSKEKNPSCSRIAFKVGLVVNTVTGPLVDVTAYSFAPQSLIAPFGGLDVVWNALFAPYFLGETLTRQRALGCALVVAGTVIAGSFGNHQDPEYTLDYVAETVISTRVMFYTMGFLAWFVFNRCILMRYPPGSTIRGFSLGVTAGTLSGNMFCTKASVELLSRSIDVGDSSIWMHWLPYCLVAGAIFFAVTNVFFLTRGLQEYEALFMVTIYEGSGIVSGCVSGALVLLDLRSLEMWRIGLYFLGVLVVVIGMVVIFYSEGRPAPPPAAACGEGEDQVCATSTEPVKERTLLENLCERSAYAICPEARSMSRSSSKEALPEAAADSPAPSPTPPADSPGCAAGIASKVGCVPILLPGGKHGIHCSPSLRREANTPGQVVVVVTVEVPKAEARDTAPLRKAEARGSSLFARLCRHCWRLY